MAESDIPPEILRFLEANIDTVPELETLLLMSRAPERGWVVAEVASHNYITQQRAEDTLNALHRRGLASREATPPTFRFTPASADIRELVANLDRCYRANLARIATFIHSKPSASVREFARAFDLKKDH